MHILFLTDNFPPETNAPASRTFDHCVEWVKRKDCKVTVITCFPNFPKGEIFPGYKNRLFKIENISGINVIRVWSYIAANHGTFKRILDYISFMVASFIASFFVRKVNVVIGTSPQFFTVCSAYAVSVVKRIPWIFELRDIWPESIKAVEAIKENIVISLLEKIELFLYRKATKIVSVTHTFRNILVKRGIDNSKIEVITNGVDLKHFKPLQKDSKLLEKLGLKDKFIAGYIGTHGMAHGLEVIIDAAVIANKKRDFQEVHFLLLGDGSEKSNLLTKADSLGLTNISFIDSVAKDEVHRYWSILDASIIHLKSRPIFETVIPSKIFECMAMGIPILHGVRGESLEIVQSLNAGISFQPENPIDLIGAIAKLKNDPSLREHYRNSAIEGSKNYDRIQLSRRMLHVISEVTRSGI